MKEKLRVMGVLVVMLAVLASGCATSPAGYDRVATTSLGMGALGTALGYAATGDAKWAAVGGLSGLATGYVVGQSMEGSHGVAAAPPPAYYGPEPSYGYYGYERCRTVRRVIRENGRVVRVVEKEVCDQY